MRVLITGGLGVNGAVTARLMVQDGLRPVLMDNRMDLTLMGDIKDQVDVVIGDICNQSGVGKGRRRLSSHTYRSFGRFDARTRRSQSAPRCAS